jgi:hypothetical protein
MLIIGCDFHTRYQQIAMMDTVTGELGGWPGRWMESVRRVPQPRGERLGLGFPIPSEYQFRN